MLRREAPAWWYGAPGPWPTLLAPLSALYAAAFNARWALAVPKRAKVPVLCVGNLTVGGAGKTPVAIAAAQALIARGERPVFLSRGYGGKARGPVRVDLDLHDARQVGDEPLLLARVAPVVVAADRVAGAAQAETLGASVIVMDDGFQNPHLAKDLSLVVVDGAAGIGNGHVLPAGPLRGPLAFQLACADAMVIVGPGTGADGVAPAMGARPVLRGTLGPSGDAGWLKGARVVAFAGIGRPSKFFATLEALGAEVVEAIAFPDHHRFEAADAKRLLTAASQADAVLVTTEKDQVRLDARAPALADLARTVKVLGVRFQPDDAGAFADLVASVMRKKAD